MAELIMSSKTSILEEEIKLEINSPKPFYISLLLTSNILVSL